MERGDYMRGRQAKWLNLAQDEQEVLQRLAWDKNSVPRTARRAHVLLAMSDRTTCVKKLAKRFELTRSAVWRLCRRFNERGLKALFDAPRPGRPKCAPAILVDVEVPASIEQHEVRSPS